MSKVRLRTAGYLKKKRISAGLTQSDVAKELGYSTAQFVSNWERGLCHPPMNRLGYVADVLKANPKEILDLYLDDTKDLILDGLDKHRSKRRR